MHEEQPRLAADAWQFAQKLPAAFAVLAGFELLASPEDCAFGPGVKAFGIEQRPLVVIAEDDKIAVHDPVDALARVGAVADDVAQAIDLFDALRLNVREDGIECFQISVNVADDGSQLRLHA